MERTIENILSQSSLGTEDNIFLNLMPCRSYIVCKKYCLLIFVHTPRLKSEYNEFDGCILGSWPRQLQYLQCLLLFNVLCK